MSDFRKHLETCINAHSKENGSDTPDWILAEYLLGCLEGFDAAVTAREKWYGRAKVPVEGPPLDPNRCAVCGWALADCVDHGCVRGNCSRRPLPTTRYDAARAEKEAGR